MLNLMVHRWRKVQKPLTQLKRKQNELWLQREAESRKISTPYLKRIGFMTRWTVKHLWNKMTVRRRFDYRVSTDHSLVVIVNKDVTSSSVPQEIHAFSRLLLVISIDHRSNVRTFTEEASRADGITLTAMPMRRLCFKHRRSGCALSSDWMTWCRRAIGCHPKGAGSLKVWPCLFENKEVSIKYPQNCAEYCQKLKFQK